MSTRKILLAVVGCAAMAVVSFLAGSLWAHSKWMGKSEDIIGSEVRLLNRHAKTPSCNDIKSARDGMNTTTANGDHILWRYDRASRTLKKVVVSSELDVAYDESTMTCD